MKFIQEYRRRKAQGDTIRPIWQIIILIPLYLIYLPARAFVDWMDRI